MWWSELADRLADPLVLSVALAFISGSLLMLFLLWSRPSGRLDQGTHSRMGRVLGAAVGDLDDQLCKLTGQVSDRLEAKLQVLREQLRKADRAIEELRRLTALASSRGETLRAETAAEARRLGEAAENAASVADEWQAPEPPGRAPADQAQRSDASPRTLLERHYAHVYWLADAGLDALQIATKTGMHPGEVQLVLALRARQAGEAHGPQPGAKAPVLAADRYEGAA